MFLNPEIIMRCRRTLCVVSAGVAFLATTVLAGDAARVASPQQKEDEETLILSPFCVGTGPFRLGATPGGFKDINYGRTLLEWGMLPRPGEITPEGLFSEFDLPTPEAEKSARLLSITGDAKAASILNKPEVTHLAQLGFSSGLDARTWSRSPVYLVVVADVSGSMEGNLPLLKESVRTLLAQLGPADVFGLVSFSDDTRIDGAPEQVTPQTRAKFYRLIDQLAIRGGTNIEAGLKCGFDVAQKEIAGFNGRTRVVLITDAMPNIGATAPSSFMGLAETASLRGIGLTTIGVGLEFSAEFVRDVSSVSGGNAFYFADAGQMQAKFAKDFDFMVTELAFDVEIRVDPAPGFRLVGVYGLPGDVYTRTPEGGMLLDLKTLFLSRERGAIFLSFAGDAAAGAGARLGRASLAYSLYGVAEPERSAFDLVAHSEADAGVGLTRGELLINEYEALRTAGVAFYETGELASASAQVEALASLFASDADSTLVRERELLENVASFLNLAAREPMLDRDVFRQDESVSPLIGAWRFVPAKSTEFYQPADYLVLLPGGQAGLVHQNSRGALSAVPWSGRHLGDGRGNPVTLSVEQGELRYRAVDLSTRKRASWRLERCAATAPWREIRAAAGEASDSSEGYVAVQTLAGSRVQTELSDLAACVVVLEPEQLAAESSPDR
jgi:Ca-activated chloride channel homolog